MDRYMGVVGVCIVGLYSRVVLGRLVGWTFFFFFFFFFWLCFLVVCLCAVLCFVFRCPNQVSIEVVDMILNQESGRDETCENFFAIAGFDFCFPIGI